MMRRTDLPTFVYFARRADGEGPVKIGCSHWPEERLKALMCWAPYPLALVATVPGDEGLERRFHSFFAEHWSHREWFNPSAAMTLALAEIAAGVFDFGKLPEKGSPAGSRRRVFRPWRESQKAAVRLGHVLRRTGIEASAEIAGLAARLDEMSGDELAAAWAAIVAHCKRPEVQGSLYPAAWAAGRYAAYAATKGLPPLQVANADPAPPHGQSERAA